MTPVPFHPSQPIIFPFDLSFYLHQILFTLIMVTTVFFPQPAIRSLFTDLLTNASRLQAY